MAVSLPATADAAEKGIETDLTWGISATDRDRTLAGAADIGARWMRITMSWHDIESSRGSYKFGSMDTAIAKAKTAGFKLLVTVYTSPGWASGSGNREAPPQNVADYANFMNVVATRYRGQVDAWEIWNEENFDRFWPTGPNAAQYAQLLKAAYPAVKAADPAVPVVFGGLAFNDYAFLEQAYAAVPELGRYFDVMATHPYTLPVAKPPEEAWLDGNGRVSKDAFSGYREVRSTMLARGDDKPIWLTEFGWSTNTVLAGVSESDQADYLTRAFRCLEQDPYVQVAIWFEYRNNYWAGDADTWEDQLGLVRTDFSRKQAYESFKSYGPGQGGCRYQQPGGASAGPAANSAPSRLERRLSVKILRITRKRAVVSTHRRRSRRGRLGVVGRVEGARGGRVSLRLERRVRTSRGSRKRLYRWARGKSYRVAVSRSGSFRRRLAHFRRGSWRLRAEYRAEGSVARSRLVYFRM
jgi:hypothetical protein